MMHGTVRLRHHNVCDKAPRMMQERAMEFRYVGFRKCPSSEGGGWAS